VETPPTGEAPYERILAAARRVVSERGMTALSVQAVAAEAGVTKSAISYHFGSKDGLVRAIIASMAVKEPDEARMAVGRIADPAERFHAFMSLYLERVRTNQNFRIAFALGPTAFNDEKMRVSGRTAALDMEALHLPRSRSVGVLMAVLMSSITGLAFSYASHSAVMDLDACFAQLEECMAPAFLHAMTATDPPPGQGPGLRDN
jgi:AcrR family transcriptional regulator